MQGYQASMIDHGIRKLDEIRYRLPNAGGLVIPNIEMVNIWQKLQEIEVKNQS